MLAFQTTPVWCGGAERPCLGWLSAPTANTSNTGVLVLPSIGYEYWSAHRTLRTLAEQLAASGHHALRLDYDGIGDSAGGAWDDDRLGAWRRSVADGAKALRDRGAKRLVLVGLRFGAALALLDGAALGADAIVAWAPVTSGKRFAKELRMLGIGVPSEQAPIPDSITFAGLVLTPATVVELQSMDLEKRIAIPAPRVLVVARPERGHEKLVEQLVAAGAAVDTVAMPGTELILDAPAEDATVPHAILDAICAWVGPGKEGAWSSSPSTEASFAWAGTPIREQVVVLADPPLTALRCGPTGPTKPGLVVFLNSGSEPHIGPGRAWVDYARGLAARGVSTMRVDFSGWGESLDQGRDIGRPYDAHCVDETRRLVRTLCAERSGPIVLVGLCAGAWVAMSAALDEPVDAIFAINPQLYWAPGQPVEALLSTTRKRRTAEREREERGGRSGLWSWLDQMGFRPRVARWLERLRRRGVKLEMLFAEGDDGLEYLRNRLSRALARELTHGTTLVEIPGVDHQMYRLWYRPQILDALARFVT